MANQAKGQSLIYIMSAGVGSAFGALCGGWLLDHWGVNAMLVFCCLCAALGTGLIIPALYSKHPKGAKL